MYIAPKSTNESRAQYSLEPTQGHGWGTNEGQT